MRTRWHHITLPLGLWLWAGVSAALSWQPAEPARLAPLASRKISAEKPARLPANANAPAIDDVGSAMFQNVRPGEATADEVRKLLGEPLRVAETDEGSAWTYGIEPFAKVDLLLTDNVVTSIVLHLKRPTEAAKVAKDLNVEAFRPAPIPSDIGPLLGIAYPERGVTLGLSLDERRTDVTHVLLEAISAEPFVLRAQYDTEHKYTLNLADLTYAEKLDQGDARIGWLRAQLLGHLGQRSEALASAAEAIKRDPTSIEYRLTHAWLLGETGAFRDALTETREILALPDLPRDIFARAECLLGDLHAAGPAKDYKEAIACHLAAIKAAAPLVNDERFAVRRAAKQVLIDAHLGAAYDVAWGEWKRRDEVVPKWLSRAESLTQDYLETDRGDLLLKLNLGRKTLAAMAGQKGVADPTAAAALAISEARQLLAGERDPLFRRRVACELGQAMLEAARIEQARGKAERALEYVARGATPLEDAFALRPATLHEQYLLGQLYFLAGTVQALQKESHAEAVKWYDKAAPRLSAAKAAAAGERGRHGERFVSMGVSYWNTGARDKALQVTLQGVEIMKQAVAEGSLEPAALAVPYGNLANMSKDLGQAAQAQVFGALAERSGRDEGQKRR